MAVRRKRKCQQCRCRCRKAAPEVEQEPVAWMTHHCDPMLFLTEKEAAAYCDDGEPPVPLYMHPQPAQGVAALVEALEYISKKSQEALKMADNRAGRAKDEILCGYAEHIIQSCGAALASYRAGSKS